MDAFSDDVNNTFIEATSTFGSFGTTTAPKWTGGVLAPNGKIYCPPTLDATSILVIDPTNDTTTTFGSLNKVWAGGVLAPNGKIYFIPSYPLSTTVLLVDPTTNTVSSFGSLSGYWESSVLASNGKIYAPSADGARTDWAIINTSNDTNP
jgi:hypothetical protein